MSHHKQQLNYYNALYDTYEIVKLIEEHNPPSENTSPKVIIQDTVKSIISKFKPDQVNKAAKIIRLIFGKSTDHDWTLIHFIHTNAGNRNNAYCHMAERLIIEKMHSCAAVKNGLVPFEK